MSNIEWKISTLSDRRLEAEIANIYHYRPGESEERTPHGKVTVLGALWAEFDLRVANGTMTDDEEGLLNDTRKY